MRAVLKKEERTRVTLITAILNGEDRLGSDGGEMMG